MGGAGSGRAGLDLGASFIDVPGGTTHWTFTGGTNYLNESGDVPIAISKADATVSVTGYTGTYDATAHGATGTATGVGGVDLSASLYANGSLVAALSYTDTPTSAALGNLGTSLSGGYIGIAAGAGPQSTGVFYGINLTGLAVAIPEPTALLLLAGGLAGLATARRLRR